MRMCNTEINHCGQIDCWQACHWCLWVTHLFPPDSVDFNVLQALYDHTNISLIYMIKVFHSRALKIMPNADVGGLGMDGKK